MTGGAQSREETYRMRNRKVWKLFVGEILRNYCLYFVNLLTKFAKICERKK
jgi:hypothetical protein